MDEHKPHPPHASRIAEARRAGFAPRPQWLGFASGSVVLAVHARLFTEAMSQDLRALLAAPLAVFSEHGPTQALAQARALLARIGLHAAYALFTLLVVTALLMTLAQGPHFAWPQRAARGMVQAPPSRLLPLLVAVCFGVWFVSAWHGVLWLVPSAFAAWWKQLWSVLLGLSFALSLIDVSLARAAFFRSLFMSRRELLRELREAYGDPQVRAARERVRRTQYREPHG